MATLSIGFKGERDTCGNLKKKLSNPRASYCSNAIESLSTQGLTALYSLFYKIGAKWLLASLVCVRP